MPLRYDKPSLSLCLFSLQVDPVFQTQPLQHCVKRLQAKADKLLKYMTDRKDCLYPSIPSGLPFPTGITRPRINGNNGYLCGHATSTATDSTSNATSAAASASTQSCSSSRPVGNRKRIRTKWPRLVFPCNTLLSSFDVHFYP